MDRFVEKVAPDIERELSKDVLDVVRHMPKQELAAFAESLVTISSVKRKVTVGPESVGGPVDVAVISRHEGFVWVSRKHYFTRDLNPRYVWRAMRADEEGGIDAKE